MKSANSLQFSDLLLLSLALWVVPAIYKNSMEASHGSHYVHHRVNKDKKCMESKYVKT